MCVIDTGRLRIDKGAVFTPGIDAGVHIDIPVPVYLIQTDNGENVLIDTGLHPANLDDPYQAWGREAADVVLPMLRPEDLLERRLAEIDVQIGEAIDVLHGLAANPEVRFDIAFLYVDKARVRDYFEQTLNLMAPGGLIIVDNALWHGWVLDAGRTDADTSGMRKFNDEIATDSRVQAVLLPIADGIWLIRRRGPAWDG